MRAADACGEPPAASAQQIPGGAHGPAGEGEGADAVPTEPHDAARGHDGDARSVVYARECVRVCMCVRACMCACACVQI